jgi:hypothetical protein
MLIRISYPTVLRIDWCVRDCMITMCAYFLTNMIYVGVFGVFIPVLALGPHVCLVYLIILFSLSDLDGSGVDWKNRI